MDFSTGSEVTSDDVAVATSSSKSVHAPRFGVKTDAKRDALLTEFGKETLKDRYLLPGEGYQDLFARVAAAYADDEAHAQRVYDYISKLWFMPATPVLSNGGTLAVFRVLRRLFGPAPCGKRGRVIPHRNIVIPASEHQLLSVPPRSLLSIVPQPA